MKSILIRIAATLVVPTVMVGCSESPPDVTDEQILSLLGSKPMFSADEGAPQTIAKKAEECIRLIAGVDQAIYKDMPQEMLGQMKTECRQEISGRLGDARLNPMGLKLEHIETPAFAERTTAVRAKALEQAKVYAEQERERQNRQRADLQEQQRQARIQERAEKLQAARTQLASLKEELPRSLDTAATVCSEFEQAKKALRARAPRSTVLNRAYGSNVCQGSFARRAKQRLEKIEEEISKMRADADSLFAPQMPYLGEADTKKLQSEIETLRQLVRELEDA